MNTTYLLFFLEVDEGFVLRLFQFRNTFQSLAAESQRFFLHKGILCFEACELFQEPLHVLSLFTLDTLQKEEKKKEQTSIVGGAEITFAFQGSILSIRAALLRLSFI
jgi:hypothetical protein